MGLFMPTLGCRQRHRRGSRENAYCKYRTAFPALRYFFLRAAQRALAHDFITPFVDLLLDADPPRAASGVSRFPSLFPARITPDFIDPVDFHLFFPGPLACHVPRAGDGGLFR